MRTKSNLDDFETVQAAKTESVKRQRQLRKKDREVCNILADALEECMNDGEPCGSAACPICVRELRLKQIDETLASIEGSPETFRVVTLIYYSDAMTNNALYKWNVRRFINKVYKHIQRSGFNGIAIGGVEFDYHLESKQWMPHLHLVMSFNHESFRRLRAILASEKNLKVRKGVVNRPMHVRYIKDLFEQVSYNHKVMPQSIAVYQDKNGKRRTRKYRLVDKEAALAYVKLDKVGFAGLTFKFGVRSAKWQLTCQ